MKKGASWETVCLVRNVISGPMVHALDDEIITANPVSGVFRHISSPRGPKREIDPLNHEEVVLFLETCAKSYPEHSTFFLTAFRPGMRLGELLALQWRDIDWHGKFILVRRSYKRGRLNHTKTGKQRRVDMSNQLFAALKELQLARKKEALESGAGKVEEFIFYRDGKPIAQISIRYPFKRILEKGGLREIRFHDIRHTYASLDGASPVYVKEQMGHSSIQITVDIYCHLIPNSNRDMVNRLDTQPSATYPQPAQIGKP
jgi:integrase